MSFLAVKSHMTTKSMELSYLMKRKTFMKLKKIMASSLKIAKIISLMLSVVRKKEEFIIKCLLVIMINL